MNGTEIRQRWHDYFACLQATGRTDEHMTVYLSNTRGLRLFAESGEQVSPDGFLEIYPASSLEPNVYIGACAVYNIRFNTKTGEQIQKGGCHYPLSTEKECVDPSIVSRLVVDRDAERYYADCFEDAMDSLSWKSRRYWPPIERERSGDKNDSIR